MAQGIRVGVIGAGWPGLRHCEGYQAAGGFSITAVADLIPARRRKLIEQAGPAREFADGLELIRDIQVDAVSICLPNDLHFPLAVAALKAGKHVLCESPPTLNAGEARKLSSTAARSGKTLLFAMQRRFGPAEQAARLAVEKGYVGAPHHVRASWMRTRGIPTGTGWYSDRAKSGGGVMIDMGLQLLDLGWSLLGQPRPVSVFAVMNQRYRQSLPPDVKYDVEDAGFVLMKFEGDKSMELSASWAINQPPRDNGTKFQLYAERGAVVVYSPRGPLVYRGFTASGEAKETPLKTPKTASYHAMMRHFKECIATGAGPLVGGAESQTLMQMSDAIYRSAETGKSVEIRGTAAAPAEPVAAPERVEAVA